jgi:hypothetical protein
MDQQIQGIKSNIGMASGQRDANAKANEGQDSEINKLKQNDQTHQGDINSLKQTTDG